jgi:hypothetical protein
LLHYPLNFTGKKFYKTGHGFPILSHRDHSKQMQSL